jgi:hypothetical protein
LNPTSPARPRVGRPDGPGRAASLLVLLLIATGCAAPQAARPPGDAATGVEVPSFVFERDTFAFANLIRSRHPDVPDLYANYCFVVARGLRQFFQFARFDPGAPRLRHDEYVERVRQVTARSPWQAALRPAERVVIPGYRDLREFSRAQEAAVKAGLESRWWTWVHWTNWRVTFPLIPGHQAGVLAEIVDELGRGRLVQLLVTNLPKWDLNHTLVVYAARPRGPDVDLVVWDPNDPDRPGVVTFRGEAGRFWATGVHDTEPGPIRVFRMYYSWLL